MKILHAFLGIGLAVVLLASAAGTHAATPLESRVNEAFRGAFGRNPTQAENSYWRLRVQRREKTTFAALQGAMFFQKAAGGSTASTPHVNGTKSESKDTLIIQTLPLFVKVYGNDPTNAEKAWWRKRISCGELNSLAELQSSMAFHKAKKARKGSDTICGQKAGGGGGGGVSRASIAGLSDHIMGDQVRIGIMKTNGSAISVTSNGKFQIREGGSKIRATKAPGEVVSVSWSDGTYHVRGAGTSFDSTAEIRFVPLNQAIMEITTYKDPSPTIPGKNYNRFRGIIEIRRSDDDKDLWAINELRTEYYLRGLAESSDTGPEEYIKALGAAARTYVLYHKVVTGGRSVNGGWDILNTSDDQVYRGYEYEIITPRLTDIFGRTRGTVVTDSSGSNLVTTVYFSDSDGRTRSAKEKWGTDRFPHLQHSVDDPHHASGSCRGHCVGMSAQGAFGFAKKDGWSFSKILSYYYKGIKLVKAY